MLRVGAKKGLVVTALAVASAWGITDTPNDLGKAADSVPALRGFRWSEAGAPPETAESHPSRKLLFERTYLKDGLMLRFYGILFASKADLSEYIGTQQRTFSGHALDVSDDSFRSKGIRLVAYGSKNAPTRSAQAVVNRVYLDGLAVRTDRRLGRPVSVALTPDDLAALRSVMAELIARAKRMPENKRP